MDLKNNNKVY